MKRFLPLTVQLQLFYFDFRDYVKFRIDKIKLQVFYALLLNAHSMIEHERSLQLQAMCETKFYKKRLL